MHIYNTAYGYRGRNEHDHPKWGYKQSKDRGDTNVLGVWGEREIWEKSRENITGDMGGEFQGGEHGP